MTTLTENFSTSMPVVKRALGTASALGVYFGGYALSKTFDSPEMAVATTAIATGVATYGVTSFIEATDRMSIAEALKDRAVSRIAVFGLTGALAGGFMGAIDQSNRQELEMLRSSPVMDPKTTLVMSAEDIYCTPLTAGKTIAVKNKEGKVFSLTCK
ncbi:MAG: hypothetical protein ACXW30_00340 [Micavibrio sp.]